MLTLKTRSLSVFLFTSLAFLSARPAHAIPSYSLESLENANQDTINEIIETVAIGTAHRAYMPASSMGLLIGLDVGVEVTAIGMPSDFKNDIESLSSGQAGSIPAYIPLPKLNVHKGLPFGIDVGASYIGYKSDVRLIGGDAKWTFFDGGDFILPAAAVRLNYTNEKLWYINGTMWQADVLASKDLIIIEPYIGAGVQKWSGNLSIPTNLPSGQGLPANVSASSSGTNMHVFAGLPIKLTVIHLTPEVDYSTAKITSFGLKLSLNL